MTIKKETGRDHWRTMLYLASIILLGLAATSCTTDDVCLSYQHNVQAGFYSAKSAKKADTTLTDVKIFGLGRADSALYDTESISKIFLNLNLNQDYTGYVIHTKTLQDTIEFWYSKELSPISGSCGVTFSLTIDSVAHTNTFIDSVSIIYPALQYKENAENVKIFIY